MLGQRGFPGTVMPQDGDKIPGFNIQADFTDGADLFRVLVVISVFNIVETQLTGLYDTH